MKFYNVSFVPNGYGSQTALDLLLSRCYGTHLIEGPGYSTLSEARRVAKALRESNPVYFQSLKIHKVIYTEVK